MCQLMRVSRYQEEQWSYCGCYPTSSARGCKKMRVCEICAKRHRTGMYSSRRWWHSWWYQGHGDTVKSNKSSSESDDNCNWRKLIPTRSHGQQKLKPSNITYFKIKMLLVTLFKTIWQTLKLAKSINFHFHWQITKSLQITDT